MGGGSSLVKKTAWVKWKDVCKSKYEGGLGIKDVQWSNYALLSKWAWRFLADSECVWSVFMRARLCEIN
jgi:hypothetical protein